jgi:hypothetical protein
MLSPLDWKYSTVQIRTQEHEDALAGLYNAVKKHLLPAIPGYANVLNLLGILYYLDPDVLVNAFV